MGKILSISEKRPVETSLPDGVYTGTWGGSVIDIYYNNRFYELKTDHGVRGINIKVIVTIKDGVGTFIDNIKN